LLRERRGGLAGEKADALGRHSINFIEHSPFSIKVCKLEYAIEKTGVKKVFWY
jgi:hypothetical protein